MDALTGTDRMWKLKSLPDILIFHLAPFAAIFTHVRWYHWVVCLLFWHVRMFFITAGYHRYFAHRGYKMGRKMQFVMALMGTTSVEHGPLWWAANHRHHHKYSDQPEDVHSPVPPRNFF